MPKATLTFNLPDENDEFIMAQDGINYSLVLNDLRNYLRGKLKYEELTEEQYKIYEEVRNQMFEFASHYNVEI